MKTTISEPSLRCTDDQITGAGSESLQSSHYSRLRLRLAPSKVFLTVLTDAPLASLVLLMLRL